MDDIQFRVVVGMMIDATQGITHDYMKCVPSSLPPEDVHDIVCFTLLSQLTCTSEMTQEQQDKLVFCVGRGDRNPDNCGSVSKEELN